MGSWKLLRQGFHTFHDEAACRISTWQARRDPSGGLSTGRRRVVDIDDDAAGGAR